MLAKVGADQLAAFVDTAKKLASSQVRTASLDRFLGYELPLPMATHILTSTSFPAFLPVEG